MALEQVRYPAYGGIKRRFKLTTLLTSGKISDEILQGWKQKNEADLTGYDCALMEDTAHAILLKKWIGDNIWYQDPNYPRYDVKLTLQQFIRMAGDTGLLVRSILPKNTLSSLSDTSIRAKELAKK